LRADDRSIYGKKGSDGIICVKTKQGLIVSIYGQNMIAGDAAKAVEGLADYLISVGY
jgi:profilin